MNFSRAEWLCGSLVNGSDTVVVIVTVILILIHFWGASVSEVHHVGRLPHGRLSEDGALRLKDEVAVAASLAFSLFDRDLLMEVRDKLVVHVFEGRPTD